MGAKLLCSTATPNNHLRVIHWDEYRDKEWNSSQGRAPPSFTDLLCSATLIYKAKKPKYLFFFSFLYQEHNLQIQAIVTSECGEDKACTCPAIFQSAILHEEKASGKIYKDRQNDTGFKPKNGFLFQSVKERH